jgi:CPA1 family monovalent cation:H+ antiporter
LIALAVVVVLASRAVVVYGLTGLTNRLAPRDHIPISYRHVMFWGGLRGAIGLALALSLATAAFDAAIIRELQIMAFAVVLFTLLVQGTTITVLLRRLGLGRPPEHRLEQERRRALLYAGRAGRRALEQAFAEGTLSAELHVALATLYDGEIDRRNRRLRELLYDYPELEQGMILQVRRDLLRAERTALRDANQRGMISDDAYGELIRGTDNQLEALDILWESLLEDQQFGWKAGE